MFDIAIGANSNSYNYKNDVPIFNNDATPLTKPTTTPITPSIQITIMIISLIPNFSNGFII
jgi:hypothetical protein